jgi:hypothetical protein
MMLMHCTNSWPDPFCFFCQNHKEIKPIQIKSSAFICQTSLKTEYIQLQQISL